MSKEKIQKILARHGHGSRRQIEAMIEQGKITVDNKVATIGLRISTSQLVKINSRVINLNNEAENKIIIYNKPRGEICSKKDPELRKSVYDSIPRLPKGTRWVMVGRLDINSEGLLLFTTNGEYANFLMHPSTSIPRVYKVRVCGSLSAEQKAKLLKGVKLEDGISKFDSIKKVAGENTNAWYEITISSGKNRIIRRMLESQGLMVNRLVRIKYGSYTLPKSLKRGSSIPAIKQD